MLNDRGQCICPMKNASMPRNFPRTCVAPHGKFTYGIHKPEFIVSNLRENDYLVTLGHGSAQEKISNKDNFPPANLHVTDSPWVFEIPNAFPFMGTTFILKSQADRRVGKGNPFRQGNKDAAEHMFTGRTADMNKEAVQSLPRPVRLALARTSDDPNLLVRLAELACLFEHDAKAAGPSGMRHEIDKNGKWRPLIVDKALFYLVSNNPYLPDTYKRQMVLCPGVQGGSPIVGEYTNSDTHIWEYLRENSYIPWGHYAANMAHDAVRYRVGSLTESDMIGLRHLYYQRIYVQLATQLGIAVPAGKRSLTKNEIEDLRRVLIDQIAQLNQRGSKLPFNVTVWGQNFGADMSPSGYRLNASHQQIHQQFALATSGVPGYEEGENALQQCTLDTYTEGDLLADFVQDYKEKTGQVFFRTYLAAIQNNRRMDGRLDEARELAFYQDENVIAFVPKAQRSHGEVQIVTKKPWGNILEVGIEPRYSLDRSILIVMKTLENLGAEMICAYEISKRFDNPDSDQHLLYCFLPKHPQSPGGFSEWQKRWIIGHYPEDFAEACGNEVRNILSNG